MNVRLSHNVNFSAVMVDGLKIFPNNYNMKLNLITITDNHNYQNIALQRILFFIHEIFDSSVFISEKNAITTKLIKLAKDSQIIQFPEDPFDQIVGMILFDKLDAIVEERLEIESIVIGSDLTQDLFYTIDEYQEFEYDTTKIDIPWWDRSDLSTINNLKIISKLDKWKDINLDWDQDDLKDVEFILDLEDNSNVSIDSNIIVLDGGK